MIFRRLPAALAAAGLLGLAPQAFAAPPVVAKLQQPLSADARLIAGGAMFVCHQAQCVATSPGSRTLALSTCQDLAKTAGAVESFGDGRKSLGAEHIARCNASAPPSGSELAKR